MVRIASSLNNIMFEQCLPLVGRPGVEPEPPAYQTGFQTARITPQGCAAGLEPAPLIPPLLSDTHGQNGGFERVANDGEVALGPPGTPVPLTYNQCEIGESHSANPACRAGAVTS